MSADNLNFWEFLVKIFTDADGKPSSTRMLSFVALGMVFVLLVAGMVTGRSVDVQWVEYLSYFVVGNQGVDKFSRALASRGKTNGQ